MKKKLFLFLAIIINSSYICLAQPQETRASKAEAIQIAYLTKELDLTPEEAQKFWPVFNNYKQELLSSRKAGSPGEIEMDEKILNIRKKYKPEFKRVLGNETRVNKLYQAEKNFRDMLKKELMKRRGQGRQSLGRFD
jgi:hypothetical protein